MAQCKCYSIQNDSPSSYGYYNYQDCNTGQYVNLIEVPPNTTVYSCAIDGTMIDGSAESLLFSIMNNDSYCGGCTCDCETFTGFVYKGAGGTISITYTNCNDFTGTITNIIVPQSADGGGNQSTYLFAEHYPFSEQPSFCAKVGTSITKSGNGVGLFNPILDGCCNIVNNCYSWTVNDGDILPSLLVSYTNFEGTYINQVEVLTNILYTYNVDGTYTYYLCSSTEPQFFEGSPIPDPVVPPFTVELGGTCNSDLECSPNTPYTVYLVSDCCGDKPDGYMYLPVGLTVDQVVGSSTDNTCYKIVEAAEAVANLDWDGSVFNAGQCQECQTKNQYFCQDIPVFCEGNLIYNPTFDTNLNGWSITPYIDDWSWSSSLGGSAQYGGADEGGYLSQNVLTVGNTYSISFDVSVGLNDPTCLNLSVFAGDSEYVVTVTNGLSTINTTLTCTTNTTFSIYAQTACYDEILIDNVCILLIPPTPTPTPTITPTPTLTPTPTSQPTIIYFQKCCNVGQYLGVYNYYGTIISEYSYLSMTVGPNTFCVKLVPSVPYSVTLYDFNNIELNGYDSCEDCKIEHPCPPPPTQEIMGYRNECGVITIFPMSLECVSTSPSTPESNDGMVSVSITGGTPPYKYTWEGIGIGNDSHAPAIENVNIGEYTVTVVDFWGDFTATTTCTLSARTDCSFSGTVSEFIPPTPSPTPTMTPTPSSIPSRCDCRYGNVYISQNDIDASDDGAVYVSYQDCNGICYCLTIESNNAIPYPSGVILNDICIDVTTSTGIGVSLFIMVDGDPQVLPIDADSYVTLGGCCTTPIP